MDGINLAQVPASNGNPRSTFDLSFKRMFDHKFGDLIPVMMLPTIPGDEFDINYEFLNRMAPFISQVYQDYKLCFDYYFVPNQLTYKNFELFMSAGYDGNTSYVHPYISQAGVLSLCGSGLNNFTHTIFDYLDISPTAWLMDSAYLQEFNALPFAAYIQCYLDHHVGVDTPLNKVLQEIMSQEYILNDGNNTGNFVKYFTKIQRNDPDAPVPTANVNPASLFAPFQRLYPLDYFTSCRSSSQLGPVMTIPLTLVDTSGGTQLFKFASGDTATSSGTSNMMIKFTTGSDKLQVQNQSGNQVLTLNGSVISNVATIPDFYSAARLQELLTLYGYSGFTPSKRIAAEFGVKNPDSRMHRSQWLHSSIHDISIGEVFSSNVNAESSSSSNLDIPGSGTAIASTGQFDRGFHFECSQYGYLVGLLSVYPEAAYHQGIPRHMSIKDRFDYPHPALAEIGMAAVKQKEIFATQNDEANLDNDFGYMSQYGDHKVGINRINGAFRTNLMYMSASRYFGGSQLPNYKPRFNDEFLKVLPSQNDLNRTFNVVSNYVHDCPLISKVSFNIRAKRQLPYYGLPRF